jgi:hypothetical protein
MIASVALTMMVTARVTAELESESSVTGPSTSCPALPFVHFAQTLWTVECRLQLAQLGCAEHRAETDNRTQLEAKPI